MASSLLTYVVVSGNSGAGKSTLVRSIAARLGAGGELTVDACDERQLHHPFLMHMFEDPDSWSLPVQLNFLTQRACRLLKAARDATPGSVLLMERCLWEDKLFFEYYVRRGKIASGLRRGYGELHSALVSKTNPPDVMVHLRARTETLHRRLELAYVNRDRNVELRGDPLYEYLEGMNEIYEGWRSEIRGVPRKYFEFDIDEPDFDPEGIVDEVVDIVSRRQVVA